MTATLVDRAVTEDRWQDGDDGRSSRPRGGRLRRVPLWGHLLAFALLLACVAPIVRPGIAFTTDEGAYGLQQRVIADTGSFAFPWKGSAVDPNGRWYPIVNGTAAERGNFPYVAHPAYPLLLRATTAVAGETAGLLLLPLLGALMAAAAAWWLAEEIDERLAPLAFWLAALGPLFVNAWIIWAHAPGAALAGLALVAILRAGRGRGMASVHFALGVAAVVAGALLRSENVLFAAGAALAYVIIRRTRASTLKATVGGGAIVVAAAATAFLESRWRGAITGAPSAVTGLRQTDGSFLAGRLSGMYHSLLLPDAGRQFDLIAAALSAAVAGLVVVAAKRRQDAGPARLAAGTAALGLASFLAVVVATAPTRTVTGLVAAWPVVLVIGAVFVSPMRSLTPSTRALAAATAVLVAGVLATQYAEGGGLEWGGRFFSPVTAPLAALAAMGVVRCVGRPGSQWRAIVGTGVAAMIAVPAVAGVAVLHARHVTVAAIEHEALGRHPAVVVTSSESLPRNLWRSHRDVVWYLVLPEDVGDVLGRLRAAGVTDAEVIEQPLPASTFTGAVAVERRRAPVIERLGAWVVNVKLR